jgi:hypothetical protein
MCQPHTSDSNSVSDDCTEAQGGSEMGLPNSDTEDMSPDGDGQPLNQFGSAGILGLFRQLLTAGKSAAKAGEYLRAAGIPDEIGQQVDEALARSYTTLDDLVSTSFPLLITLVLTRLLCL